MNDYIIYTDGAYSSSRDKGGIGIVILKDNKIILEYSKGYSNTTNNRMELTAIIIALSCIKNKVDSITVISDSQYCIGCISKGWKRKKNQDLWNKFDFIESKIIDKYCSKIKYEWTKGHTDNNIYNNKCDKLAVDETLC